MGIALKETMVDKLARLTAENETLRKGINWQELEEYACTGTDKPCGCYELLSKEKTENIELRAALEPFANAAAEVRKQGGDPAYGLRWDDFLRAQNCFASNEQGGK